MDRHPNQTADMMTRVADLVYRHKTETEICRELHISMTTAVKHIKALKEEWKARRETVVEAHFEEQLARLDMAESGIWDKVLEGYAPAVERWLGIMDMRNKLLGLYAPAKQELDIGQTLANLMSKIGLEPELDHPALPAPQISIIDAESRDLNEDFA